MGEGARERLRAAYDPELFRQSADLLSNRLATFLSESLAGAKSFQWVAPPELQHFVAGQLARSETRPPSETVTKVRELLDESLDKFRSLHSPLYMGHQVPPPLPIAGLFDMLGAVPNQANGVYEMGPLATSAERALIAELGGRIGWAPGTFDGIATSGGSLANLTALLTARNRRYPESWANGLGASDKGIPTIIAGADSHYSVTRAVGVIGLGANNVLKAALDSRRKIDVKELERTLKNARAEGRDPFCLVASSCSTSTGSFDSLSELGALAKEYDLWFHVDGAHGASVLFSERYRGLVKGIELADSITWDAHKMMYVPALLTFLLYRDKSTSYSAFQQDAPYLFDPKVPTNREYDGAIRTLECTKRTTVLSLWGAWAVHGPGIFADLVDTTFDTAREFQELIQSTDDFQALHAPEANIFCFRYLPNRLKGAGEEAISAFHTSLHEKIVREGNYYLSRTKLDGKVVLRVTLMNPFTNRGHLEGLLEEIRAKGSTLS